jgi:UvrD/REP helicase N-terminal domain
MPFPEPGRREHAAQAGAPACRPDSRASAGCNPWQRSAAAPRRPGCRHDENADTPSCVCPRCRARAAWEILAVTFIVRAGGELRLRPADLLGEEVARAVTAATFHSVCARLLREHAGVFGRTERYTIYDQGDMRRVVDWLLSDAERGQIRRVLRDGGQPASVEVLAEISRA